MWNVVAEGIQTVLRREGYPQPYEALKALTRTNTVVDEQAISQFIDSLNISDDVKEELHRLSPQSYTGF
jgi:adenylosuccinate lyase